MNFDLGEDEQLLRATVERFVADRYPIDKRRAYSEQQNGFSTENWHTLGELGILGASLPSDAGGMGFDRSAIASIHEALGHGIALEPVIDNALLAAGLLAGEESFSDWHAPLVSGEKRVAVAHAERGSRGSTLWIETTAETDGDTVTLTGSKPFVIAGHGCEGYLVSARHAGQPGDDDGWSIYLVPSGTRGLGARGWRQADGIMAVALSLDQATVPVASAVADGPARLAQLEALASLARSAEMLGLMERLFADTLEYLRTREQFGVPLGNFQVLQHRMTAQYAKLAQARALLELAIVSGDDFATAAAGARAFIAKAALELGHEAIQMHGGMGVTDELAIGHGHKRILMLSRWPDDARAALDRFARIAA